MPRSINSSTGPWSKVPASVLADSEHYTAVDFSALEPVEHVVDRVEREGLDGCLYFAFAAKERASSRSRRVPTMEPHGVAVQDHVEDGDGKLPLASSITDRLGF